MHVANSRLFGWAKKSARPLTGRLTRSERVSLRFLGNTLSRHWKAVLLAFTGNLMGAIFEGSTMGVFALALQSLSMAASARFETDFGALGALADGISDALGRNGLFMILVGAAVAAQLLRSALEFVGDMAAAHLQAHVEADIRRSLFNRFVHWSYAEIARHKTGDLASYSEQVHYIGIIIQRLNTIVSQFLLLLVYAGVLLWLSWPMTLISVVALTGLTFSLRRIMAHVRHMGNRFKDANVRLNERFVEYLYGIKLLHTFGRAEFAVQRVHEAVNQSLVARRSGLIWQSTVSPITDGLTVIGVAAFLLGGYYFWGAGDPAALARLATFLFVVYRLMPRVSALNKNWALANNYLPFVDRIASVLDRRGREFVASGDRLFTGLRRRVEFANVSFHYGQVERVAVQEISLQLNRGEMVALVGESGSGKSTLVDLLLRLYDPTKGAIRVDGIDLPNFDLNSWRERIGVVSQDAFIFHATVRENIAFGKLDATDAEIIAAARSAHAHEFILELGAGYETLVGDKGYRLSGGQRQRIAIARAILRDPEILILDEATSDLDSYSEQLIREAVDRIRNQRTILSVAHRLSTIAMADRIVVLDRGRIVEQGTHAELLAASGKYAQLWQLQVATHVDPQVAADGVIGS